MKDSVLHQVNPVTNIVSHMAGLQFPYPPQGCKEPTYAPTTTPIPNAAPMMAPIFQPNPAANVATDAAYTITHQMPTSI